MTSRTRLCLLLVLSCLPTLAAVMPAAAASSPLREGNGYRLANGDFVGYYLTSAGTKVYCLSPRKALPSAVSMSTVTRYAGASRTVSRELAYALTRWGDARGQSDAAVESQLLNSIVGNGRDVRRRAASLPKQVAGVVAHRLALARRLAGPYRVDVHLPTALLPGQSAVGTVRVLSAAGHAVPGVAVTLRASRNAVVPGSVRAGAGGLARFRYRVADIGAVRVSARAAGLAVTSLRTNHPASSQQRMVASAGTASASGSAGFHRSPRGFTAGYSCTTACAGRPMVTLRACAEPSSRARRMVWHAGRHVVVLTFAPTRAVTCRSSALQLADGDHVGGRWQFRTAHGWSRPVAARGAFVVDCPPVPAVAVSMSYDCTAASLTIALATVNTTPHQEVLVVGGAADRRIVAGRGQRAVFSTAVSCAHPLTYTMQAGIQRADGGYHYGAVAVITTPRS